MKRSVVFFLAIFLSLGLSHAAGPRVPSLKPDPPASPHIAPRDEENLRAVFDAIDQRNYELADALRTRISDPIASSLANWAYLRGVPEDEILMEEVDAFLDAHFGWPNSWTLQNKIEDSFTDETPSNEIFAFFDGREPVSGEGRLHLARAYLSTGARELATAEIRKAWIDEDWSTREERDILNRYGNFLTPEDHWAKADRQLFEIHATATRRLIDYLPAERREEALTRIAFLRSDVNGKTIYANLPPNSQNDAGVLHAAVRYHRRNGLESEAIRLAGRAPIEATELRNPDAWYTERSRLARWALKNARFEDVYVLSAYSGLDGGADFAGAEFMAGWSALRFLNDPDRAKAHFAFMSANVGSPISRAKAEYWLGRAYAAAGELDSAQQHYRVAAAYPYTFYGQLAIKVLGEQIPQTSFPDPIEPDPVAQNIFTQRSLVKAMHILAEIDEDLHFDRFARALDDQLQSVGEVQAFYDLVASQRKTYLAVRGAKVARNNGVELPSVIYPMYHVPETAAQYAEKSLILGLSRQESEFNPRAYSSARARGIMQLLSSTARITARKEGLPYSTARLMDDPSYNMVLGAAHLSHLLERFEGSYIMVLGAYNAGSRRVDDWIETYGDPRDPDVDPIDWIEMVPFAETRNYIMRVTENTQVYRSRLDGLPLGKRILEDITRGGGYASAIGINPPSPRLMIQASLSDPEPSFGQSALNIPTQKTRAEEIFDDLDFPLLHTVSMDEEDERPAMDLTLEEPTAGQ